MNRTIKRVIDNLFHQIVEKNHQILDLESKLDHEMKEHVITQNKFQRQYIDLADLQFLMSPNRVSHDKIDAIKHVRVITGCGLREAKDFIDAYNRGDFNIGYDLDEHTTDPDEAPYQTLGELLEGALKESD